MINYDNSYYDSYKYVTCIGIDRAKVIRESWHLDKCITKHNDQNEFIESFKRMKRFLDPNLGNLKLGLFFP